MASFKTRRTGYTLLEIVLVMAIIVMVSAVAYPALENYYGSFKVIAASDSLKGAWAQGRSRAIEDGTNYRLSVIPGSSRFRIAPDRPEFWSGNPPTPNDSDNPPLILESALPKGIVFSFGGDAPPVNSGIIDETDEDKGPVDPGSWVTVAQLLPDGTASLFAPDGATPDEMVIVLSYPNTGPVKLRLRGLTGTIKSVSKGEDR